MKLENILPINRSDRPKAKKTLLFAPTWGLRSCLSFITPLILQRLSLKYRLLLSLHRLHPQQVKDYFRKLSNVEVLEDEDLLKGMNEADLLISDVSSAAYEFLYFNKPMILIDTPWNKALKEMQKEKNIEYLIREEVAFCIDYSENLEHFVHTAIKKADFHKKGRQKYLKKLLFFPENSQPSDLIIQEIERLIKV